MRLRSRLAAPLVASLTLTLSSFADDGPGASASSQPAKPAATVASVLEGLVDKTRPGLQLELIGRYETGVFDESAAEIAAYDPGSFRLFVTNGDAGSLLILDLADPTRPTLIRAIDLAPWGAPNSVAVMGGRVAVAVKADPSTDPGQVAFFDLDGNFLTAVTVGSLPDMVTFTGDGSRVLTANEGEPDGGVDPAGSISIIDLGAEPFAVTTLDFEAFDGRRAELAAKGVRLFPDVPVSLDLEPEYIAVSPDDSLAFVSLQEANSFAVVDLESPAIVDLVPLGLKNHTYGSIDVTSFFLDLPPLGTTATVNPANPGQTTPGQTILLGGLSGLWFDGVDVFTGRFRFVTVPDRGPNGEPTDLDGDGAVERPFPLPDYQARIVHFEVDPGSGDAFVTRQIPLVRADGSTPVTGLPNIPGVDEEPVDLFGNPLPYDALGADMEGVVRSQDGHYWTVDEYRPSIYRFDPEGRMIDRFVPAGSGALGGQPAGAYGTESLPAEYSSRRRNRGFEALALDPTTPTLYAFVQTPLANPDRAASDASDILRILAFDPVAGRPVGEYVYLLEAPDLRVAKVDKIGDAVWTGSGRIYVIERDSSVDLTAKKYLFEINLKGATNLLAEDAPALLAGKTLEEHTPDELAALGIRPVSKIKAGNLPSLGYRAGDKPEGLALLPSGRLAVLNDNDFGLLDEPVAGDGTVPFNPAAPAVELAFLSPTAGDQLDASDRDGAINIRNWPVFGQYMPDALDSFSALGRTWFLSANEGDARSEDERVADLPLDPEVFPNAAVLQQDENLGRLEVSTLDGDLDGDGDYDRLHAYGGRSFTVWDEQGNLVWDSSDDVAWVTALAQPGFFNASNDENGFDARSDAKGAEPEAVEVGSLGGRLYAFCGLERVGGILVYDLTDPLGIFFVGYINSRDFLGDPEAGTAGDLGPEGLLFIEGSEDGARPPTLVATNEVSGTVSVYRVIALPPAD
ncbi:MAG: esterase-like activity of phytase family protein [Acidobacteriota bacterium]